MERTSSLDLSNVHWLVIDEADRLLEMGFERDVHYIIDKLVKGKTEETESNLQTVLLSATLTMGI